MAGRKSIPIRVRPLNNTLRYPGGQSIEFQSKIDRGPDNFLDRYVTVNLSFEEVFALYNFATQCRARYEQDLARTEAINKSNQGGGVQ